MRRLGHAQQSGQRLFLIVPSNACIAVPINPVGGGEGQTSHQSLDMWNAIKLVARPSGAPMQFLVHMCKQVLTALSAAAYTFTHAIVRDVQYLAMRTMLEQSADDILNRRAKLLLLSIDYGDDAVIITLPRMLAEQEGSSRQGVGSRGDVRCRHRSQRSRR